MHEYDEFLSIMGRKIKSRKEKPRRLFFEVDNEDILEIADYLFNNLGCRLSTATALETYNGIEVIYHFSHDNSGRYFCPKVIIKNKQNPRMYSITPVVRGAEWIEREMSEMCGIIFEGHPRKEQLLTRDNFEIIKVPLRKLR